MYTLQKSNVCLPKSYHTPWKKYMPNVHTSFWFCFRNFNYRHTSFYRASQISCFLQIEGLRQPCVQQVCWRHFPNSIWNFMSLSHFGSSRNISNFIIIVFVMVISDFWCYYYNLLKVYIGFLDTMLLYT